MQLAPPKDMFDVLGCGGFGDAHPVQFNDHCKSLLWRKTAENGLQAELLMDQDLFLWCFCRSSGAELSETLLATKPRWWTRKISSLPTGHGGRPSNGARP